MKESPVSRSSPLCQRLWIFSRNKTMRKFLFCQPIPQCSNFAGKLAKLLTFREYMNKIVINHLYADHLNIYGDLGNIIALQYWAEQLGYEPVIHTTGIGGKIAP